jgi:hypothetical protein
LDPVTPRHDDLASAARPPASEPRAVDPRAAPHRQREREQQQHREPAASAFIAPASSHARRSDSQG